MSVLDHRPDVLATVAEPTSPVPAQGLTADTRATWVLRLNLLRRRRVADDRLRHLLLRLEAAETEVVRRAEALTDELYLTIGSGGDHDRAALVALRRDVHNDRAPRDPALLGGTAHGDAWCQARADRDAVAAAVVEAVPAAEASERRAVSAMLGQDDLRRGLAMVAPDVAEAAQRWSATVEADERLPARLRKSERGLLQYLARAMVRTSPLSRFTAVGVHTVDDAGMTPQSPVPGRPQVTLGLDRVMLDHVLGGLVPTDGTDGSTWVQLPVTADVDPVAGRVYFFRLEDSGLRRLSSPVQGVVGLLLEATVMGPRQVDDVAAHLVARAGLEADQAREAVRSAVEVGLLSVRTGPEDATAPVLDLLRGVDAPGPAGPHEVAQLLQGVPTTPTDGLPAVLRRLTGALEGLSHRAGRPSKVLVAEDAVLPPALVRTDACRPRLDDLAAAVELMSAFDPVHDVRAVLLRSFVDRHGPGSTVSLCATAQDLLADVAAAVDPTTGRVRADAGPHDGSSAGLARVRDGLRDLVGEALDRAAATGASEATVAPADVRRLAATLPPRFRDGHLAYSVLVQTDGDRFVVNDAYAGHGMLYGRFLRDDNEAGRRTLARVRERLLRQHGGAGARVVEDAGLHRLNVNAHVPVLPDRLAPRDWFGMRLRHDPVSDRLVLEDRTGRPTTVLTLGAGHPDLQPAPLRLATALHTGGRLYEDLVGGWRRGRPDVVRCPRLVVGDVVLARARWYDCDGLAEAVAAPVPDPARRLAAVGRWRRRHGVPAEVVLKADASTTVQPTDGPTATDVPTAGTGRSKPQYVDLESLLFLRVLPRLLQRRDASYVEEAAPAVASSEHAAEWMVEIGRHEGGHFEYEETVR